MDSMKIFKFFISRLPERLQSELKRIHYRRQILKGTFRTFEPEFKILPDLIAPGDWVIDIGANVGHYTKQLSELVGAHGRVIAFEPVITTFALLSANVQLFTHPNVTLINAAVSDITDLVGISIPHFSTGLFNYYQAHLSSSVDSAINVLTLSLDSLCISNRIALIKIDTEGHESFVLNGMRRLLTKHHPILVVETDSKEVIDTLCMLGYAPERLNNSPNIIFKAKV
jgi:FkbM family methyltransferase